MARQFTDRDLIWGFLKLEDLLVDELALLVHDDEGVWATLHSIFPYWFWAEFWECDTSETAWHELFIDCAALSALGVDDCRFTRQDGCSDDDTWNSHQPRNLQCIQVANCQLVRFAVQKELVRWERDLRLLFRWVDNAVCTLLQSSLKQGNDFGWLSDKSVCQGVVEGDEMGDVDVAVVLAEENILADLVSVIELDSVMNKDEGGWTCRYSFPPIETPR